MFSRYFKKARRLGHPLGLNNAGLIFRGADLKETVEREAPLGSRIKAL